MTGGRILALNEFDGFRPMISVINITDVIASPTSLYSTVYSGNQLMCANDTEITHFLNFLSNWKNVCTQWTQAKNNIDETMEEYIERSPHLPIVPVQTATLKLLNYGYDPLMRYWLQFEGHAPLFRQSRWWVEDESGDDYNPAWR